MIGPDGIIDIELMLNSGKGYKKVGEFENLALYKAMIKENSKDISSEGIIPHIYSPSKINIIEYEQCRKYMISIAGYCLMKYLKKTMYYFIDKSRAIDVNTESDFKFAEFMFKFKKQKKL